MSDFSMDAIDETEYDTVLSEDIEFSGTLMFDKPFLIKGTVNGTIQATGNLMIAENARVVADISAPMVSIRGYVEGNVNADKRVELSSCGTVIGDICAPEILMETGCVFNGNCTMKASPAASDTARV